MHILSEINKWNTGKILCDKQMDRSLVNQISRGGGDTAVAPLAYFSPFTSQSVLLGGTVYGGSSATLGLSLQDSKVMAAHKGGGGIALRVSTLTVHKEGARAKMVQSFPFLHSPFALTLQLQCLMCVCYFLCWVVKHKPSTCFCCVNSRKKRCIKYLGRLTYILTLLHSPSYSSSLTLLCNLRLLSLTVLQQIDICNYQGGGKPHTGLPTGVFNAGMHTKTVEKLKRITVQRSLNKENVEDVSKSFLIPDLVC